MSFTDYISDNYNRLNNLLETHKSTVVTSLPFFINHSKIYFSNWYLRVIRSVNKIIIFLANLSKNITPFKVTTYCVAHYWSHKWLEFPLNLELWLKNYLLHNRPTKHLEIKKKSFPLLSLFETIVAHNSSCKYSLKKCIIS